MQSQLTTGVPALNSAIKRLLELDQESVLAILDMAQERVRQVEAEGWTPDHDDKHDSRQMSDAAAAYALAPHTHVRAASVMPPPPFWPWDMEWWKPKSLHRNQVRAGALLLAEIARRYRVNSRSDMVRAELVNDGDISTPARK